MAVAPTLISAAQSHKEAVAFIEAFARVNIEVIRRGLGTPAAEVARAERGLRPDWDDPHRLLESGIHPEQVDEDVRAGTRHLHIDVAASASGVRATRAFLALTGLSAKLQSTLFPELSSQPPRDRARLSEEVVRLNAWLRWVRGGGFDPTAFITYQRSLTTHGKTQNLTGAIGATGAAIAFLDAIRGLDAAAVVDHAGEMPPARVRSPQEISDWRAANAKATLKALLLRNGRALVFASSKDANIFMPLGGEAPFADAADALARFNEVRNDQEARSQVLHEFAVGEVKTATDLANLHERLGLASRETQTELRTDRFLMMAVLNREILEGGVQRRTMNNRDLTRFSHVFNLHHCWGWDGGRTRHPDHWGHFVSSVRRWCRL
ncbi:hypothetical protein GCM10009416_08180 [Craurococcus roseus]|uniref:Uncharacterized protein n=1 Tax=Craurococcus roseus TaxID=77585 RepID=A0ABN1ERI4_9PROT